MTGTKSNLGLPLLRVVESEREAVAGRRVFPHYTWISIEKAGSPKVITSRNRFVWIEFLPYSEELFTKLKRLAENPASGYVTVSDKLLQYGGRDLAEVLEAEEAAALRQWQTRVPKSPPDPLGAGAVEVSYFQSAFATAPSRRRKTITLEGFLYGVQSGEWREEVEAVRGVEDSEARRAAKRFVPAVSPSCRFSERRVFAYIVERSGFLNLDLDDKDNPGIAEQDVRARLYSDPLVYAGHVSVSGRGLSLYVRIANPEKHREAFLQLEAHFWKQWGIRVDKACKDITRLRFVSYDPELYLNVEAWVFSPEPVKPKKSARPTRRGTGQNCRKVESALKRIASREQDITGDYADWVKIAYAFAGEFGESGRGYFHDVSKFNERYDPARADAQFSACLSAGKNEVSLGTFFYILKQKRI